MWISIDITLIINRTKTINYFFWSFAGVVSGNLKNAPPDIIVPGYSVSVNHKNGIIDVDYAI